MANGITYIDGVNLRKKRILLRVDFNISLSQNHKITNDERIRQSLSTIRFLLKNQNKLILVSHLGEPAGYDKNFSLAPIAKRLQEFLPKYKVVLVSDFTSKIEQDVLAGQKDNEIILLENIRFFKEEKANDINFAKKLAALADVFVNDAFGVCHRNHASVVSIPKFLPAYGGLLLKKEVETITSLLSHPQKPFVAIIGGAKVSTKINLLQKIIEKANYLLLGGGLANTFLAAQNYNMGKSLYEKDNIAHALKIIESAKKTDCRIILPQDVIVKWQNKQKTENLNLDQLTSETAIFDIGEKSQKSFQKIISEAKTILWNGPVGFFEDKRFRTGTKAIYEAISKNKSALSVLGGGDTINAVSNEKNLDKITHISTGGGAMLSLIENGTLPGLEALKNKKIKN